MAACVCLGPGEQNLRIAGCVRSKPEFKLLGKRVKDFWDEENIVPPLQVRAELAALPYSHPLAPLYDTPHGRAKVPRSLAMLHPLTNAGQRGQVRRRPAVARPQDAGGSQEDNRLP